MNENIEGRIYKATMDAIGDAIRDRNGLLTKYLPSEMPTAIESIPNNYTLADEGKVVKNGALVAQTARATVITENGTFDTTENNSVTVNVSGGSVLPNEYQRVLYVQNNNAYINTGIAPDSNTTVYLKAVLSGSTMMLFGSRNARNNNAFDFLFQPTLSNNQRFRVDYGNTESTISQPSDMTFLDIVFGASGISANGNTPASALTFSGNQYPLSLFAVNDAGSTTVSGSMKCFSFKIISGETTVMDFIPCRKKSDNEAGFYDLITSTFFGKSGSGTLIAGPDAN